VIGMAVPTGAFCGICTFTCVAPAIRPGAWPAKCGESGVIPIEAVDEEDGTEKWPTAKNMIHSEHLLRVAEYKIPLWTSC
jgi:hypothetical protein